MTTPETQMLPGVPRVFDAEKDTRNGKTLLILKEGSEFQIGTTYVKKGKKPEWKENTFKLVLRPGDEITMYTSDSPEFVEFDYQPLSKKDKPNRFRVTRDILENVLEDAEIAVLKERKVEETREKTVSSIQDILAQTPLGFSFSVKGKVAEDMVFSEHKIKNGDTLVIDSKDSENVSLKVFEGDIDFSKKGKLRTAYSEVTMSVVDFERLVAVDGVTNFRKKALALLEETK